jgi:hypothetical protein
MINRANVCVTGTVDCVDEQPGGGVCPHHLLRQGHGFRQRWHFNPMIVVFYAAGNGKIISVAYDPLSPFIFIAPIQGFFTGHCPTSIFAAALSALRCAFQNVRLAHLRCFHHSGALTVCPFFTFAMFAPKEKGLGRPLDEGGGFWVAPPLGECQPITSRATLSRRGWTPANRLRLEEIAGNLTVAVACLLGFLDFVTSFAQLLEDVELCRLQLGLDLIERGPTLRRIQRSCFALE